MNKLNTDTLITFSLDPVCVIGEICKIHKYKHIEVISKYGKVTEMQTNYLNENFDLQNNYFVSESGQIFFTEKETTEVNLNYKIPENIIRFSDTLKLNELKYLNQGDSRSANELVVIYPKNKNIAPQIDLNAAALGVEMTFMLVCTTIYLIQSIGDWAEMICRIKFALKS
jgi:hypothetical protein